MQVPEQMSDMVVLASATHKMRRSVKHGLEAVQQVTIGKPARTALP